MGEFRPLENETYNHYRPLPDLTINNSFPYALRPTQPKREADNIANLLPAPDRTTLLNPAHASTTHALLKR